MCNRSGMQFGETHLLANEIAGKTVIEVGAVNFNGSLRNYVESLHPSRYLESIELYSIVTGRRCIAIRHGEILRLKWMFMLRRAFSKLLPGALKDRIKRRLFREEMI